LFGSDGRMQVLAKRARQSQRAREGGPQVSSAEGWMRQVPARKLLARQKKETTVMDS